MTTAATTAKNVSKSRNGGGAIRAVVNFFESLSFTPKTDKKLSRVPTKPKGGSIVPSSIAKKLALDDKLVCMSPFVCLSQKKKSVFNVESVSTLTFGDDDAVDVDDGALADDEVQSSRPEANENEA